MTGLNLETFLKLVRVDLGVWASLGLVALILALMTWTSWGSRRALRKCLVLSIAAHVGLIVFGGSSPIVQNVLRLGLPDRKPDERVERIRVTPWIEPARTPPGAARPGLDGTSQRKVAAWDQDRSTPELAMLDPDRQVARPDPVKPQARPEGPSAAAPIIPESVSPEVNSPTPSKMDAKLPTESPSLDPTPTVAPGEALDPVETPAAKAIDAPTGPPVDGDPRPRTRPADRPSTRAPLNGAPPRSPVTMPPAMPGSTPGPAVVASRPSTVAEAVGPATVPVPVPPIDEPETASLPVATASPDTNPPELDVRPSPRPGRSVTAAAPITRSLPEGPELGGLARATPAGPSSPPMPSRPIGRRTMAEVPPVYRSRLDPNRTALAQRAGASLASEQAVEQALEWLAKHQDADGRWDGATATKGDGTAVTGDDSFTIHCPPGDICLGECRYWEADTALTGLALLAYLGAGYTHVDGKHANTVGKGIDFLRQSQKPDGDLRGPSLAVGMYCHAMATLALCEAYALTGDSALKPAVEKAVGFLVRARAGDGLAWRYKPGDPEGDTSILGWAVMALKSGKSVGIPIPPPTQAGMLGWLKKISTGKSGGLGRYQPNDRVTPTMTAEAWACRQFLEVGGPGATSDEAAAMLLANPSDRGTFNIYYLYYGTLGMYQHGGEPWTAWNARVRDDLVRRQRTKGHMLGSWDPDDSPYGRPGGRIYGTALATLTLEVYYRFLRLYEPASGPSMAPKPADAGTRRAGFTTPPPAR